MNVVELSGGVGGARLARGLASLAGVDLTVIVNVGDDTEHHGLYVSPDVDTVIYTLAGTEGPYGWGRADETFHLNEELARFGVDNTFRLGDRDAALKIFRTLRMQQGESLSFVTAQIARSFGLEAAVIPVSDDPVRTKVRTSDGWISFMEYFVNRRHRDEVHELRYEGAGSARPAPGVVEAIEHADLVVIGPSNPPMSIEPILAVPGLRAAVAGHPRVVAVSPLIGGKAVKGPADRVMVSLGHDDGNRGVAAFYEGLIDTIVIDRSDAGDSDEIDGIQVRVTDTLIRDAGAAGRLAAELLT